LDFGADLEGWWHADGLPGSGNIATWSDSSAKGRDLTQVTSSKQPIVAASFLDGYPAASFDGIDDLMSLSFTVSQPVTIYTVAQVDSANTVDGDDMMGHVGAFVWYHRLDIGGEEFNRIRAGSELNDYQAGVDKFILDTPELWTLGFNGASSSIRMNDVETSSGSAGTTDLTGMIFAASPTSRFADVNIVEVAMIGKAVSVSENTEMVSYLSGKYATLAL
jgi:hypothetical protein